MMKQVEQIEDCYEWGKENLDLPLSNVENEDFEYLISTIKQLHAENERYREAFEVVKSDYITYETERAKLERKYAFESKEKSIDKYARIRDTGAVEALSNILFALDVDEYKLQQKARQALEQSHD